MTVAAGRRFATAALGCIAAALALAGSAAAPPRADAQTPGSALVRVPLPRYDGGLTPYTFELGQPLMMLVYDTLMWRDTEGIPRPWLARSIERSRGGRRITIRLQPDARWHDGRRVTAADVVFTMRYMAERRQPRFTPQLDDVLRVTATGRLSVSIDLRRASLGFEDQPLADVPILPRHLWRTLAPGRRAPAGLAVGSGPYRLVKADATGGYVLRANRRYFKGVPRVAEIRVPLIGDAEDIYGALRMQQVDMVPLSLPRQTAGALASAPGIDVQRGPLYTGTAVVLNTRRAPFADVRARRAVAAALDLRGIARNVGPATPADRGYVHPASRWAPGAAVRRSDVAAARRELAQLGLPLIRVLAPVNDPIRYEAGRQVALALRQAGASATLVDVSPAQLSRAVGEDGAPPDFDAAIMSIPPLVSHDPGYLAALFGSRRRTPTLNVSGYRSDAFDAATAAVGAARDRAARSVAILAQLRVLDREAPAIALFFTEGAFAYRSVTYDGWTFVKGAGIFDKRSFLGGATAPAATAESPAIDPGGAASDDSGSGIDVLSVISLTALAAIVVLVVLALLQRRRSS